MIGRPEEETDTGQRDKMEKKQLKRLEAVVKGEGIKAALKLAAADIVTLKIELARAQLVKPVQLDGGKAPKLKSATRGIRG